MNYAKSCFLNLFAFFRLFAFLLYTIFLPSTFSGTHVRTVRAGSIRPTPLFFFKRLVYYVIWKTIETIFAISSIL